jgi:XTP/dITP diphosphohydrolase
MKGTENMKIAVATKNAHKVKELSKLMSIDGIEFVSLSELGFDGDIEENGTTFEENALIKARYVCKEYNLPAISDDSGLCVDALSGAPGIYSARYASVDGGNSDDRANIDKLLSELKNIPEDKRTARFVCAMALCLPDGRELTVTGKCEGKIMNEISGKGGFGYDPIFFSFDANKTFGEASDEEKNKVSHRANAVKMMSQKLCELFIK